MVPLAFDHPEPGERGGEGEHVQGVADQAGLAGQAGQARDLAVGRDPAARDARDHLVDPAVRLREGSLGAGHGDAGGRGRTTAYLATI